MNARNAKKNSKSHQGAKRTSNGNGSNWDNNPRNDRLRQTNRESISGRESRNTNDNSGRVGNDIPKYNDPAWYNNDGLLDLAGRLSFADALGERIDLTTPNYNAWDNAAMPGAMTLRVVPSVGISIDNRSAVNIAAQEMYNKVRSVQTSAAKYGKQDLMMYYLAVQNAHNLYWMGVRALGLTNFINRMNRYVPLQLSKPLGFDLTDISKQTARFANILNFYAKQLASYAIPANFDFAKRQRYMFSNVFTESTAAKSKFYIIQPDGYFTFKVNPETAIGELEYNSIALSTFTVDEFETLLDSVLASFVGDEDFGTMSGDILKTFPNSLVGWTPIDNNFTLSPIFDEVTLTSIHNAVILGNPIPDSMKITQDPSINKDYLVFNPKMNIPDGQIGYLHKKDPQLGKRLLDICGLEPTPANIAEATRLTNIPILGKEGTPKPYYTLDGESSLEIPVSASIYKFTKNGTIIEYPLAGTNEIQLIEGSSPTGLGSTVMQVLALATEFKYSPQRFVTVFNIDTNQVVQSATVSLFTPIENYAVITPEFLRNLHKVCTLSLFSTKNL